ncbi:hypothetical protein CSUI_010265 [Cystoisospora suis]|uniref:Transmembrane protein n=1 Tax=Cystoisospora suis TaxID=483139 RepID=A0A2C6KHQ2_9APIC|nr:hypothetical protein CSUI_010265 [Cystoisospora suis]
MHVGTQRNRYHRRLSVSNHHHNLLFLFSFLFPPVASHYTALPGVSFSFFSCEESFTEEKQNLRTPPLLRPVGVSSSSHFNSYHLRSHLFTGYINSDLFCHTVQQSIDKGIILSVVPFPGFLRSLPCVFLFDRFSRTTQRLHVRHTLLISQISSSSFQVLRLLFLLFPNLLG